MWIVNIFVLIIADSNKRALASLLLNHTKSGFIPNAGLNPTSPPHPLELNGLSYFFSSL